ncbi:nitrate transporter [Tothia fuscella]|uniref:Nitrate/nitrite transporter n=1 Tax=Tothia fuscella TaxID=1048955 RepID=A0A9P4NLG3_9PEZI|nr:nitrate transporter [Tothia fuscella]
MPFDITVLWRAPDINPLNRKARSIPVFNPINVYGRVFLFSWWGFMVAFMSWYAFPPLMKTIRTDLHLSQNEVSNSNILALSATLLVRAVCGPLCDRFGPRYVFAGTLLCGAIPTALAGTVKNATGLIILRFFVGILGGSFVPCQVWSSAFFDKNVVGTANGLTGGFGNSGGGITYFLMPAIFDSFMHSHGMSAHKAWRVSFVVPFLIITGTAVLMLLLCPDTPTGKWSERESAIKHNVEIVNVSHSRQNSATAVPVGFEKSDKNSSSSDVDVNMGNVERGQVIDSTVDEYTHEIVQKPSIMGVIKVFLSPQTLALCTCYFSSFGAEIAINSILGTYYLKNFKTLTQTTSGRWAAMFGLLNVYGRPLGGIIADVIYKKTNGSLWAKKFWVHFLGIMTGVFCIVIGVLNSHDLSTMMGLVAGLAFFMDAGNGANFALVPHVHPHANGIVSGLVGATGNLGGIVYAIIFRYNGVNYGKVFWIIGVMCISMNLMVSWIRPIPRSQIGGR